MDLLTREDLQTLAERTASPCISLYMPTMRFEADQEQNPIRLKNLLRNVRGQLQDNGHDEDEVDELLAPARQLLGDSLFWRKMSDGMVLFLTPDAMEVYRLPINFEELAIAGSRLHLKPLFPLIASNNRFYVLALSQNQVQLYQGTHYGLSEIESKEMPESIADALLKFEEPNRQVQGHTSHRNGGGGPSIAPHGQAPQTDDASHRPKDRLKRFFDQIDEGVRRVLGDENAPLVLAGVKYYLPIYREANRYAHLVEGDIVGGNPEHLHPQELHQKAWAVVEPLFMERQQTSIDQFHHQYHHDGGLASGDLHAIVPASMFSQVDTLFTPVGRHCWGTYDPKANTVEIHDEQQPGDDDLLNVATLHTYLNGGTVHALRPDNMPIEAQLAATFRFAADVAATDGHVA